MAASQKTTSMCPCQHMKTRAAVEAGQGAMASLRAMR